MSVDPHGRVLVVGGGVGSFGQLKIFDPLDIELDDIAAAPNDLTVRNVAYNGSTVVSDKFGGTGTSLPEGTPHRVAVLSDDQRDAWRVGLDAAPADVTVTPTEPDPPTDGTEYEITVSGTWEEDEEEDRPVTFRNRTRGRWKRVDTEAGGSFSLTTMVAVGDSVELLRNRQSLAYVSIRGVGVSVVDVNAFYNETPEDPTDPSPESDVLGTFTGNEGKQVKLCNQPVTDIGGAILDLGTLFDKDDGHPLTLVTLIGFRGVLLLESAEANVGDISWFNEQCLKINGSAWVSGLEVLEDYPFDLDGDGRYEQDEVRDYLLVAHRSEGVLILDANNRDDISLVGQIRLPGQASHLGVDRSRRRLFVAGSGEGLYVVDLNRAPTTVFQDVDGDGVDDRVLETVELEGTTNSPVFLVPELGLAYAGGLDRGVTGVAIDEPRIVTLTDIEDPETGTPGASSWRPIDRLAPFGVPTTPESAEDGAPSLPGTFRLQAHLPGVSGAEVKLDVLGVGPGGLEIDGAGDPATITDLPPSALTGTDGVVLKRLSDDPMDEGYQIYLSEEIAALADLRAASTFVRTSMEDDQCTRCAPPEGARELLSGDRIAVRIPDALRSSLGGIYGHNRLDDAELELDSVRWETSPAVRQEPTLNASTGTGDAAPGTLLHSGEFRHGATDLTVKSRGFDLAFGRTYRNQTVGAGPLGPGWDLSYRQRLRELPNGDVEYYDGTGRRELFKLKDGEEGEYKSPTGRFVTLSKSAQGWVMIRAHKSQVRFDRSGRLVAMADAVRESNGEGNTKPTGNEMRFGHDLAGRLIRITDTLDRHYYLDYDEDGRLVKLTDFDDREVTYEYDPEGRLASVTSPAVTVGESTFPNGLTTSYTYESASGDLASQLTVRDNLASITDSGAQPWLSLTYGDVDGDGRTDEVTGQTWGGHGLSIAYDLAARTATVTDRRGNVWSYQHNSTGQATSTTDPALATTAMAYDVEGLVTSRTEPLGLVATYTYDTAGSRRSRGNTTAVRVTPGADGPNGSADALVTTITYDPATNQPLSVTDPGGVTTYTRTATGLPTTITRPEGSVTTIAYNDHGQPLQTSETGGATTTYRYYQAGKSAGYLREEVVDADGLGLTTRYETDARGNVTTVTDSRGSSHTRVYNELGWVVEETSAEGSLGYRTSRLYDAAGNATEIRRSSGLGGEMLATRKSFGLLGEVVTIARELTPGASSADTLTTSLEYDANFNVTRTVDAAGRVTTTAYDARNLVSSRTVGSGTPEAVTESFSHDAAGRLTTRTDGRGNDWSQEHDGYGRLAASEDPLGHRRELAYDDRGNPAEVRALASDGTLLARATTTYDAFDRPTARTQWLWTSDPGAATAVTTTTSYDAAGRVASVTDPLGRTRSFTYDAAGRLVGEEDPLGNRIDHTLDAAGLPVETTLTEALPGGGMTTTTVTRRFDELGRLVATTDPLGNTTERVLDAQGNPRLVIDPEGHSTERVYDGVGRLLSVTGPEGVRVEYGYDEGGNRTSYTDALGNETTWSYDALGRLETVTYADGTSESYQYDAAGNVVSATDPAGTVVAQSFDAVNRVTSRSVTPAAGVEGPTTESYVYDFLGRTTRAVSDTVVTDRTYDSLSRMTSEATGGRIVSYQHDDAGNVTGITYPSGVTVPRQPDALDRLAAIPGVASYAYRGADLVVKSTVGALTRTRSFDASRRPTRIVVTSTGGVVFDEHLAWSPRSLKVGSLRADVGIGRTLHHDGAGRLLDTEGGVALPPNNSTPAPGAGLAGFGFTYDSAQNLLARSEQDDGIETLTSLPLDGSGRNRPGSVGGVTLPWDANGNLTEKGSLRFHYDYRNRLTRVTDSGGSELASYTYDAFNRPVSRTAAGVAAETVWDGWQALERYEAGALRERRTYGLGLDEVVRLERDLDGDGTLEETYTPVYDHTDSVALVADETGRIVERYAYSPYGERTIRVDSTPPAVEQLRLKDGALCLEISEGVFSGALEEAVAAGDVSLTDTTTAAVLAIDVTQPVQVARQAWRRIVVEPDVAPAEGTAVELRIEPAALADFFGNQPAAAYVHTFTWPAADTVLDDTAAPRVEAVRLHGRVVEVELSEEPDLSTVAAAVTAGGQSLTWSLEADGYTVRSAEALATGETTLTVGTALADLAGMNLTQALTEPVPATAQDAFLFAAADPRESFASTIGNVTGFQGHDHDPATGLVFARNRWLDPELGRFVSADPLGYVDGPSLYTFAGNNPASFGDPMGLALYAFDGTWQDRTASDKDTDTNIAKLFDVYAGLNRRYYPGVGTDWFTKLPCGATGCGGQNRIQDASADLKSFWGAGDREIDIIGFSRGAAVARAWANVINQEGVVDPRTGKTVTPLIRFMGLFDTVTSFGIPGNDIDIGYDFSVPPNVQTVRHAVARNEYRGTFPSMRLTSPECPPDPRIVEKEFDGAHTDIGGGYDDDDTLSRIPLSWMWSEMKRAGLPMDELTAEQASLAGGDLKLHKPYKKLQYLPSWIRVGIAKLRGKEPKRKIFYPRCPRR